MKKKLSMAMPLWIAAMILVSLSGCTFHITKEISAKLDADKLNESYGVTPVDLSPQSRCSAYPTVNVVNVETRTDDYKAISNGPSTGMINPREIMDAVALHMINCYKQSNINYDSSSSKVLEIRMVDMLATAGVWSFGSHFKMDVIVPETGLIKTYESNEGSGIAYNANANAVHVVIRKTIDDPVIQNYILCKDEVQARRSVQEAQPFQQLPIIRTGEN